MRPIIMATACLMAVSFTFIGCDKSQPPDLHINALDGRRFEKTEMLGHPMYVACLDDRDGFAANVNIVYGECADDLASMDEYLEASMDQFRTLGIRDVRVVQKTTNTSVLRYRQGEMYHYVRILRDIRKRYFVVVTGTYISDEDKTAIEQCVDSADIPGF